VDSKSPFDRGDLEGYPLEIAYRLSAETGAYEQFTSAGGSIPATNRDPGKMTVVLMTGTTALVRAVGWKMETLGMDYPTQDILDWLHDADYTHISSESSFNPDCPPANPTQTSLMFCSRPEYIQLLEKAGANLIELTGNHNNDWGRTAFNYSLDLFRKHGWGWFGGGENAAAARKPLIVEHNGNRLAFIGCNLPGPPGVWATADEPGAARCDLDWLDGELDGLHDQGILPVMTFQYNEVYIPGPSEAQARDFKRMASAGAVVVSGSQSHFPQGFALVDGSLVHYGLGNLFFDQMDVPVVGTRREFLDRHIFYGGRYLGVTLLTAMLEDYSRPRPMTHQEREEFLREIFTASGW
jgi:poly-gamma-glutamate synthesis protein (capsule biosynthesis protein)